MARLSSIMLVCFMLTSSAWAENWAHWRGPMSTGATKGAPPTQFSNTQNVKWKVAIPGAGSGSPVVWENRVFVVTSIADTKNDGSFSFEVHCYDRNNGKQLWKQTAVQATPHQATTTPIHMPRRHHAPTVSMSMPISARAGCSVTRWMGS